MTEQMQCMEVWGGNRGVDQHFHMPGLDVWIYSRPHDNAANGGDVYYLSSCASGRISPGEPSSVSGRVRPPQPGRSRGSARQASFVFILIITAIRGFAAKKSA